MDSWGVLSWDARISLRGCCVSEQETLRLPAAAKTAEECANSLRSDRCAFLCNAASGGLSVSKLLHKAPAQGYPGWFLSAGSLDIIAGRCLLFNGFFGLGVIVGGYCYGMVGGGVFGWEF